MNNKIKCNVNSCNHNNNVNNYCELDSIEISCTCDNNNCNCYEKTVCNSFKANNKKNANKK